MTDDPSPDSGDECTNENHPEMTGERLLTGPDALSAALPSELGATLGRLLGEEPVETLDAWISSVRRHTDGGSITVDDLCHDSDETDHWGDVYGDRYYFTCFYDAVILAALTDEPVDIRTESPRGAVIEARAVGTTRLEVTPDEAVFSFGIADAVTPPDGDPTHADVYGAVCPYVRAFPSLDAYGRWAQSAPPTTVAMPLTDATEVAAALVK